MYKIARPPEFKYTSQYNKDGNTRTLNTNIYTLYWLVDRLRKNYSPIIGICGDQRDGKSWFAVYIAYTLLKVMGKEFDVSRNAIYDANIVSKKLKSLVNDCVIFDEASYSYYKREWFKRPHTSLSKVIFTQGRKTLAYIFISPFINDIDKAFTKHFDIIIYSKIRGLAKCYKMRKNHMAFTDRENKRFWWDDLNLNTSKKRSLQYCIIH